MTTYTTWGLHSLARLAIALLLYQLGEIPAWWRCRRGTPAASSQTHPPGAGAPILEQIGEMVGFPEVFVSRDLIVVMFLAWLVVVLCFFMLAIELFITLIARFVTLLRSLSSTPSSSARTGSTPTTARPTRARLCSATTRGSTTRSRASARSR